MKTTSPWELVFVINRHLKKKKRKIDRETYLRMLRQSQQYTMLQRIASELYRAGVKPGFFLQHLHKDDWTLSTRVMEELERIDRGRNGYDPDRVPPILPVYWKEVTGDNAIPTKGRPTKDEAKKVVSKWVREIFLRGWTEADLVRAFNSVVDMDSDAIVAKVDPDLEEMAPKPSKVRYKRQYYVHDGIDWQVHDSPVKAKKALDTLKDSIVGVIKRAEPMPDIVARVCAVCHQPLNGHVFTVRGERTTKKAKKPVIEHLHPNCWWLKRVEPCRIPLGMELLNPATGKFLIWYGADKGGWKEKLNESTTANISGASGGGVPGSASEQPAAPVPTPPPAGQ